MGATNESKKIYGTLTLVQTIICVAKGACSWTLINQ